MAGQRGGLDLLKRALWGFLKVGNSKEIPRKHDTSTFLHSLDPKRTFVKRGCRRYAQQQQALPIRKAHGYDGRIILNCSGLLAILRQADGEN
jgi:hypothetical protein